MKIKHCEWCDHQFETSISYQIYCSTECREAATKEKIAKRYLVTRIAKRVGKERKCRSCKTPLSIYNDNTMCDKCMQETEIAKAFKELKGIINDKNKQDE